MGMYLLTAALCISTASQGSNSIPDIKVSLQMKASLTSKILKALADQTKLKFETTPQTEGEVLLVSVADVPLSELMTQIATATTAEWKTIDGGYRLTANNSARLQESNREATERAKAFQKTIAKRLEELAKQEAMMAKVAKSGGKLDKNDEAVMTMGMGMGGGAGAEGTITRLLQGINPALLANVESGDRIVFSSNPTAMQRPLASNAIGLINKFIAEHNKTVPDRQVATDQALRNPEMEKIPEFFRNRMMKGNKKIGNVSKALLSFTKNSLIEFLSAELVLYDDQGKVAFEGQAMLGGDFMDAITANFDENGKPKTPPVVKGTPIEYSPDSKELAKQNRMDTMMGGQKLSKDLLGKVTKPAVNDPLSFAISDEILAVAKLQHKPLVASLADDLMGMTTMFTQGEKTAEGVWDSLKKGKQMQVLKEDTWLVLKPAKPQQNRRYRVDRLALQNLVVASNQKGAASLDDLAAFALKVVAPNESSLAQLYMSMYIPGSITQSMTGLTDWDLVRFYGTLDPQSRNNLANGGRIGLSGLTPIQSYSINKIVYGKKGGLDVQRPGQKPQEKLPFYMTFMGSDSVDYLDEPTEAMPNGIPPSGWVELKGTRDPILAPQPVNDKEISPMFGVLGPDELAMFRMLKEDKNMQQYAGQLPTFDQMKLGERLVLNFKFQFLPNVSHTGTLHDNQFPNGGKLVSMNSLPADVQKRLNDQYDAFKKSPLASMIGMAGGLGGRSTVPPPSP